MTKAVKKIAEEAGMGIYINQNNFKGHDAANLADGILIVDKPAGLTSHDVVARVRRILRIRRVGHTGTLDPFATGVLVICLNRATRLAQFLSGDDKEYLATIRLGYATDTGDLTGQALAPAGDAREVSVEAMLRALTHFRGRIQQVPPMYSAKKVGGVRLYAMARRGEQIARQPIEVEIKELELRPPAEVMLEMSEMFCDHADGARDFTFRVVCSAGTYIRTLAKDIGAYLGVGAHLTQLRRTRAGDCDIRRAVTLERLTELSEAGAASSAVISMAETLSFAEAQVDEAERALVAHGRAINCSDRWQDSGWRDGEQIKVCSGAELIAIAEYDMGNNALRPRVVMTEPLS